MQSLKLSFLTLKGTLKEIIEDAMKSKEFYIVRTTDGHLTLKQNHNYWHQVQVQLHVTNRQLCFFVVWATQETVILKIDKDSSWARNIDILEKFFKENVVPHIVSGGGDLSGTELFRPGVMSLF